jgi:hypothetical protein
MNWNWKEWLKAAGIRAVKTFAQTMIGTIAVGAAFNEVDWLRALSVSGVACVLSLLTSEGIALRTTLGTLSTLVHLL